MKDKVFKILSRLDIILSAIFVILIFIDVLLQVFTRVTPNTVAVKWTVEMGSILLCALIWMGMGAGITNDSHTRFTLILEHLPEKPRKIMRLLGDLAFMAFCVILAYYTYSMLKFYADHGTVTTILRWGKNWSKLPMFLGLVIAAVRLLLVMFTAIRHFNDKEEEKDGTKGVLA